MKVRCWFILHRIPLSAVAKQCKIMSLDELPKTLAKPHKLSCFLNYKNCGKEVWIVMFFFKLPNTMAKQCKISPSLMHPKLLQRSVNFHVLKFYQRLWQSSANMSCSWITQNCGKKSQICHVLILTGNCGKNAKICHVLRLTQKCGQES